MNFDLNTGIEFMMHGTFTAPDGNWVHMSRYMTSYELFYVTDGTLYISDDNNDYTVKTGEYVITPPCKNQHGWKNCECTFYYFHWFADDTCGDTCNYMCDDTCNYTCDNACNYKFDDTGIGDFPAFGSYRNNDIIEKYYSLLNDTGLTKELSNHIMAIILLEIKKGDKNISAGNTAELCRRILSYIQFAPCEELRVSAIAAHFKYNEKYLTHCFTLETGESLKKHLKAEMIKRAKHILEYTDTPISTISEQLGYSDTHSFSHIFKNTVKLSPREYRQKFQENQTS